MIILKNELEAWYQLKKLLISTGYVEPNTEVPEDSLNQEESVFNRRNNMTVGGLDVARRVVKDEVDYNMDGLQSNEDDVPVKDEVVREGKIT